MCAQCAGRCRRELVARSEGSTVLQPTALLRTAVLGDRRGKVAATGHLLVLCLSVPQWKMSLSESWSEAFVCGNKRRGSLWALVLGGSRGTSTSQSPGPVRTWPAVGRLPPSAESGNALLHQLRAAPFCTLRPPAQGLRPLTMLLLTGKGRFCLEFWWPGIKLPSSPSRHGTHRF